MSRRISWDCYEVALLLNSYTRMAEGFDISTEITKLSTALRNLATHRGMQIDETYRNVNGIKMQLANVQYLFTDGTKGLSGASAMIRQMYELYTTNPIKYQLILEEANRMVGTPSVSAKGTVFMCAKGKKADGDQSFQAKERYRISTFGELTTDLGYDWAADSLLLVDLNKGAPYTFTWPDAYEYNGVTRRVNKWGKLYADLCGRLMEDYHDAFMSIMNADIPGYNSLAFADEQHKDDMRVARCFAPGFYLESNLDATTIVRKIRGLYQLFRLGDKLRISYKRSEDKGGEISEQAPNEEWIIVQLKARKLTYQDKRSWGGCLWIVGDHGLDAFVRECRAKGYTMSYKADGCKTYPSRPVWWTKDHVEEDVVIKELHDADEPLPMPEIIQQIGVGQIRDMLIGEGQKIPGNIETPETVSINDLWLPILQDSFPDGYILDDFLGQFQAVAFWQERYGKECPIQGDAIDAAMRGIGVVRDGRVFAKNDEDKQLISTICAEINDILSRYTTVYRSCIYNRYQKQLADCSIYTEQVMEQQLLSEAKDTFYSVNQLFTKRDQRVSVIQDIRKVLLGYGGPMPVSDIAKVLWFIPYDTIYHCLSVDDELLNIGNSTWMLAEHFPLTREDAEKIGDMLDEYFLSSNYVQSFNLMPLLKNNLPGIADDLNGMNYIAVFNIVAYYLRNRFSFTKSIISPKGSSIDFTDLFKSFAAERNTFTLIDLETLANELKLPIYWESTYAGGAVRVSKTDFVNRRLINFDVDTIDEILQDFCPGDYLSLMEVSSAMMMHLPSCGYRWNGYLLQSYIFGFSEVFRLSYSSFGKTGYYGAMVRRSCKAISNYGSLVERVLTDDDTWETATDALDVLVERGYQALRKYKGIDTAAEKAKQNKLSSGDRG